jgi:hypothetical protein
MSAGSGEARRDPPSASLIKITSNCINSKVVTECLGSVVGIANGYGLDGAGIESRGGQDFPHLSIPALGAAQPPIQWVPGLSRGKERPGRDADHSPPSSAVGHERVELYLCYSYEPYGLYKASVPEQ